MVVSDNVDHSPIGFPIESARAQMIEKISGNVAYAVLSYGGFLGMGQRLKYDHDFGSYLLDLTGEELRGAHC
jgi:hypothetical protein